MQEAAAPCSAIGLINGATYRSDAQSWATRVGEYIDILCDSEGMNTKGTTAAKRSGNAREAINLHCICKTYTANGANRAHGNSDIATDSEL